MQALYSAFSKWNAIGVSPKHPGVRQGYYRISELYPLVRKRLGGKRFSYAITSFQEAICGTYYFIISREVRWCYMTT